MNFFKLTFFSLATVLLSFNRAVPQSLPAGPQVQTFFSNVDDTEQPYGLYIPEHYDPSKKYPLVVMLHGAGSNHRLALRRVFGKSNANGETDVEASRYFPDWLPVDYIVASPLARGTMGYQGIAEKDVYDVLADVEKRFNIDENRVYLTGLSMGGGGTLWIGLTRPDIWAAIAPVCPAPPTGTIDLAGNALNFPVNFFQGGADPVVKPQGTRDFESRMKDLGVQTEYHEVPGVGHNVWENAYQDEYMFHWFDKYVRNPYPDSVFFASYHLKYNKAYWVSLNRIGPGELAMIDAKFISPNHVEIKTSHIDAFTLHLAGHPMFTPDKELQVKIDGKNMKIRVSDSVTFLLEDWKWTTGTYQEGLNSKKAGLEGPVADAFSSRHIYVFGTEDKPGREVIMKRAEEVQGASNWSVYRGEFLGRIMVFPRTISDSQVRPSDFESSNLILFGNKETNRVIEKYSDQLPLQLNPDSADYGLLYIYPIGNHYFVINSGLTWWTGATVGPMGFAQSALTLIPGFKDFILYKGSVKNVIAEGYFDNNWKLSSDQKDLLKKSGVIIFSNQ